MTDKEKLEKLVAYLVRRMYAHNQKADIGSVGEIFDEKIENAKYEECRDTLNFIDSMQEEPKKCMYSKDKYTDEDRKVLCDGCKEDCKYARLVWHDATEEPKYKAECLVVSKRGSKEVATYGNGFFHKGHVVCEPCRLYALGDIEKWIYIEDIIK